MAKIALRDRPVIDWVAALVRKPEKNPILAEYGRRGGLKGGKARAANLTPKQLSAIGRMGAAARWNL